LLEGFDRPHGAIQKCWPGGTRGVVRPRSRPGMPFASSRRAVCRPLAQMRYAVVIPLLQPPSASRPPARRRRDPQLPGPVAEVLAAAARSASGAPTSVGASRTCSSTSSRTPTRCRPRSCST
jgi:hypothetical protein